MGGWWGWGSGGVGGRHVVARNSRSRSSSFEFSADKYSKTSNTPLARWATGNSNTIGRGPARYAVQAATILQHGGAVSLCHLTVLINLPSHTLTRYLFESMILELQQTGLKLLFTPSVVFKDTVGDRGRSDVQRIGHFVSCCLVVIQDV